MKKAILTQEQADAIKLSVADYGSDNVLNQHVGITRWRGSLRPLNELPPHKMARALYVGYEVDSRFKLGDWVTDNKSGRVTGKVSKIEKSKKQIKVWGYFSSQEKQTWMPSTSLRHATNKEIKRAMKDEFRSLKTGSLLILNKREIFEFIQLDFRDEIYPIVAKNLENDEIDHLMMDARVKILCHAKDRKDF